MKRLGLIGLALIASFAFGAVSAVTASAENPEILPTPTEKEPVEFTASGGELTIETAEKNPVKCTSFTMLNGVFRTPTLGTADLHLKGCKFGGVNINSTGDKPGIILIPKADVHFALRKVGTTLTLELVVKLPETLKLEGGVIKGELKGSVIGSIDGVTSLVKTKSAKLLFHEKENKEEFTTCEQDKKFCEENKSLVLEASFGKGFGAASEESEGELTFTKEIEIHF